MCVRSSAFFSVVFLEPIAFAYVPHCFPPSAFAGPLYFPPNLSFKHIPCSILWPTHVPIPSTILPHCVAYTSVFPFLPVGTSAMVSTNSFSRWGMPQFSPRFIRCAMATKVISVVGLITSSGRNVPQTRRQSSDAVWSSSMFAVGSFLENRNQELGSKARPLKRKGAEYESSVALTMFGTLEVASQVAR